MSKLWDDLKENMKEWGSSAVEKAEEMSKVAVAKTEELTRISKIKLDIHQLGKEMDKQTELLGQHVYDQAKDDNIVNFTGNAEFFNYVDKIDELREKILERKADLDSIPDSDEHEESVSEAVEVNIPVDGQDEIEPKEEIITEEVPDDKPVESTD
ncbi:MAG: hypothetical protein ISR83_02340 [Candidatus Marinimicrobia bacterium]|nr:hypothetical protein [Candidatus Neomarinimicrobiota bacterium]